MTKLIKGNQVFLVGIMMVIGAVVGIFPEYLQSRVNVAMHGSPARFHPEGPNGPMTSPDTVPAIPQNDDSSQKQKRRHKKRRPLSLIAGVNSSSSQLEGIDKAQILRGQAKLTLPASPPNTPLSINALHQLIDTQSSPNTLSSETTTIPTSAVTTSTDSSPVIPHTHEESAEEIEKDKIKEEEGELAEAYVIYFVIISLIIGAICVELKKATSLPFTPMLLVSGIIIGAYSSHFGQLGQATLKVLEINPHGILLIFIPTLIFESAYNIDPFIVKKELGQIILLAVPGVAIGAVIIGIIFNFILGYSMELPFSAGLTIASIICATDPVAVVALLKEVGAPARFSTLLEGESLLNDGTAMVFFIIFGSIYKSLGLTWFAIAVKFVQLTVGGVLLGLAVGVMVLFWIKRIIRDDILTTNLTLTSCYLTFFVGEFFLGVSGIIAIVTLGVFMGNLGKVTMNPESLESVHTVLSFLQHILEILLFVITGCYIGRSAIGGGLSFIWTSDVIRVIIFFPLMTGARFLMLMIMKPFLNRWGWPVNQIDIIILTYGGLRGSIALCLALIVAVDEDYTQRFRELCLFYVICMITATVLINGLTMKFVMKKVGFYPKTDAERKIKMNLRQKLIVEAFLNKSLITENRFLRLANWDSVTELAGVKKDLEEINKKKKGRGNRLESIGHDSVRMSILPKDAITEARLRVYHQIKANLWANFEESLCSSNAMGSLREIIDICLSELQKPVWIWQCISENFISIEYIQLLGNLNQKPIIGYFSKRFLMSYLLNAYEILFNLVLALSDVFHKKSELLVTKELISEVLNEVQGNLESCEEYLFNFITLFQDLAVVVQLRTSAKIVLNKQKEILKSAMHNGSISEGEFSKLKRKLDKRIRSLEIKNVSYDLPNVHPLKLVCPSLSKLSSRSFNLLAEKHTEDIFTKGSKLLSRGKPTQIVYIVTSGFCIEEYESLNVRKGVGSVFSYSTLTNSGQLATNTVTAGEDTRVFCIPNRFLIEVMNQEPDFEKDVYAASFTKLMKNNKDFAQFNEQPDFHVFVDKAKLEKIRVNQRVFLDRGGFLFSGELVLLLQGGDADTVNKVTVEEGELIPASAMDYLANKMSVIFKFERPIAGAALGPGAPVTHESFELVRRDTTNIAFQPRETLADVIKKESDAEVQYQLIEQKHFRQ